MTSRLPWLDPRPLEEDAFRELRLRTIFECGKWDPQVGDAPSLSPLPIVLREEAWSEIAAAAEAMALEMLAAEREILQRPELWARLGLPRALRHALRRGHAGDAPVDSLRQVRFDFHFTTEGWRITEANSDVPGGYIEASGFAQLVAATAGSGAVAGDPAASLAAAFARAFPGGSRIALVHATAYTDDRQVMLALGRALGRAGLEPLLASPDQIDWSRTPPRVVIGDAGSEPVDAILRFFPAEWLPNLRRGANWMRFFDARTVPLSNPATAIITQSKRFPLVWSGLHTDLPVWRHYLPETTDPRRIKPMSPDWVLKPALGRVGEGIGLPGVTSAKDWRQIRRAARRRPSLWVAQRRFEAAPIETGDGPVYPCIGVFVIGGRAAGAYGRLSATPLIDQHASDAAVLLAAAPAAPVARKERLRAAAATL